VGEALTMEQFANLPRANFYWPMHQRLGERLPEWLTAEELPVRLTDRSHILRLLMLPGTNLLAIAYEKLIHSLSGVIDVRPVDLPFTLPPTQRGMAWHPRYTDDVAHRWLRGQFAEIAAQL
jgi:DNA-binding transcriptional LysR family regulator